MLFCQIFSKVIQQHLLKPCEICAKSLTEIYQPIQFWQCWQNDLLKGKLDCENQAFQ